MVLALVFIFVRAPHPFGWEGLDRYYELGRLLARGEAFPTLDVPWGYAYFLAPFYRLFGDRPWIPLIAQALLNGLMPALVYLFARDGFDERVARTAAVLTGVLSFNTVYASTQSSDSVCNVLFMTAVLAFAHGRRLSRASWFAFAGLLLGVALQFRPNLLLMPALFAAFHVVARPRAPRRLAQAALPVVVSALALVPWVARNAALTGEFVPTSTHGGMQLWYGTLQSGPYLQSRAYNPRSAFERPSLPYTTLAAVPPIVSARVAPCAPPPVGVDVVAWTDRDRTRRRIAGTVHGDTFTAALPASPPPTTIYYYVEARWSDGRRGVTPQGGEDSPLVFFVTGEHLTDADTHGDLLDAFDFARLLRAVAWGERLPFADRLDLDGDGRITGADVRRAASLIIGGTDPTLGDHFPAVSGIEATPARVSAQFTDGSIFSVPREWSGRVSDLDVRGALAERLLGAWRTFASLHQRAASGVATCRALADLGVNQIFYRDEPQMMRRYTALARDNIARAPGAYALSVVYRMLRVFVVQGTSDVNTTQQFAGGGRVYRAATVVSAILLALCAAGVWLGWKRGASIALPLALIAYIPLTLGFVLTNMRYSITVQPLMLVFVATALVSAAEALGWLPAAERPEPAAAPGLAGTETARRP